MRGNHLLAICLLVALLAIPVATAAGDSVTRGGTITVTVIGNPRTAYDIWVKGTHDMTGEPGDQPPVVAAGQVDVDQDPPGGPYTIGSTPIAGGGTILGDVPPDSSTTPATSYYALVTTDIRGYGTVMFRTSADTATDREFHIVAQNPAEFGEDVQIVPGIPTAAPTPVTTPAPAAATVTPSPSTPVEVTTPLPAMTVQVPTTQTTGPAGVPIPAGTTGEMTPVQGMPLTTGTALAAAGIGFILTAKAGGRKE